MSTNQAPKRVLFLLGGDLMAGKISPEIGNFIMELQHHCNKSLSEIVTEVSKRYGVKLSRPGVGQFIKKTMIERAVIAKATAQKYLEQSIPNDLEILNRRVQEFEDKITDPYIQFKDKQWMIREQRETIVTKMKYSGLNQDDKEMTIQWVESDDEEPVTPETPEADNNE